MQKRTSVVGLVISGILVLSGCASSENDTSADDAIVAAPEATREQAVAAFLADHTVTEDLAGHEHPAPETLVFARGQSNQVVSYVVATYYDSTPPGVKDASFSRPVVGIVSYRNGPFAQPTIDRVAVNRTAAGQDSTVGGPATKQAAIDAYLADPAVKALAAPRTPQNPEAIQISFGSSFGGPIVEYLVIGHDRAPSGGDNLPAGVPVGGITFVDRAITASVLFPFNVAPPSVAPVSFASFSQ